MDTLNMLVALVAAIGISIFLYKYIVSRQRLAYDHKINTELIGVGFLLNFGLRFILLGMNFFVDYWHVELFSSNWQPAFNLLYASLFIGLTYAIIDRRIITTDHYINRFDLVIYALCLAIGFATSNIILTSIFEEGLLSLFFIFSSIVLPLAYMMVMAHFIVKKVEGRPYAHYFAVTIPLLIVLIDAQLYISGSLWGILSSFVFELGLLAVFLSLFVSAVRSNVQIDGINVEDQLDRFENEKTLREKFSYRFDIFMSYGKLAMTGILVLGGLIVVILVAMILLIETPEITQGSITKTLWLSFMRVLDPGNVATDPSFNNSKFVVITTCATFIGLGIIATYIGIISGGFSAHIEKLREGNSKVLEKNHILLIGFCEDTLSIIDNMIKFQSSKQRLDLVIVSSHSRKDIENQIAKYGLNRNGLNPNRNRIICRTGDLESRNTLVNMGITRASKVIIIGDQKKETAKIAMTVNNILKMDRHQDIDIQLMADFKEDLHFVKSIFGRRMKIFSRQELEFDPLIRATVLKEYLKLYGVLIGVDGELVISLIKVKRTIGHQFGEVVNGFKYSSLIGLELGGQILLNPSKDTLISKDHRLIMLASSNGDPDYIRPDRKFKMENVAMDSNIGFVNESVRNILIIGHKNIEGYTRQLFEHYPQVKQTVISMADRDEVLFEIDRVMAAVSPDIVTVLGDEAYSEDDNDEINLKILAYLDGKYNRKRQNYVVAALLNSAQDIKFAYEVDYMDMAIENDKCRRMALEILDEDNMIIQVEEQLFEAGNRIGAVLAKDIVGTEEKTVSDIYRDSLEQDLILVGYIVREGGLMNVVINPNKNDKACFDEDDLLLVIK
jgi:hypothetical protein